MAQSDGSVIIKTSVDVEQAEKDLAKLKRSIENTEEEIEEMSAKREEANKKSVFSAAELDAEKAKLQEMKRELEEIRAVAKDTTLGAGVREEARAAIPGQREAVAEQQQRVNALQSEYNRLAASVERYDEKLRQAAAKLEQQKEKAGGLVAQINSVSRALRKMADAQKKAAKNAETFRKRLAAVVRSALVFTVITRALAGLRNWISETVMANDEAREAFGRLKGALLTIAQPLVDVLVPALTAFANVLAFIVNNLADKFSAMLGKNPDDVRNAAKALEEEKKALEGVSDSADDAKKSMAGFDTINKLSTDNNESSTSEKKAEPIFEATDATWLNDTLGEAAGKVMTALLLGGIAITAIGAAMGSLALVILGLGLLGTGLVVSANSEDLPPWMEKLGLDGVFGYVTAALALAGIALIVFGACKASLLLVALGVIMLGGAAIATSVGEERLKAFWEVLKLTQVAQWVSIALMLVGLVLVAIAAATANIALLIAGIAALGLGIVVSTSEEGNLKDWAETLGLGKVMGWVTAGLLLIGIALVVFGIVSANIALLIVGASLLGVGVAVGASTGTFSTWINTIGEAINKASGWLTPALILVGIAMLVIGIIFFIIPLIVAGAAMLGVGITIGITSGTFASWLDTIAAAFRAFKTTVVDVFKGLWNGIKVPINAILGGLEWMANKVVDAINTVINAMNRIHFDMPDWLGGGSFGFSIRTLEHVSIPRLATGSVVPPNREFLAVLGDNKQEHEVVSPLSTIKQALREVYGEMGAGGKAEAVMEIDGEVFGRLIYRLNNTESRRIGVKFTGGMA